MNTYIIKECEAMLKIEKENQFIKKNKYSQKKDGYVFKTGNKGLGYYKDDNEIIKWFQQQEQDLTDYIMTNIKKKTLKSKENKNSDDDKDHDHEDQSCNDEMSERDNDDDHTDSDSDQNHHHHNRNEQNTKKNSFSLDQDQDITLNHNHNKQPLANQQQTHEDDKTNKKNTKNKRKNKSVSSSESEQSEDEKPNEVVVDSKSLRPGIANLEKALGEKLAQELAMKKLEAEEESSEDDSHGPKPLDVNTKLAARNMDYGGALRPGEGEAIAQYVQEGKRIPRRGEVGLTAEEIEQFEHLGYVMSGSRHRRMNAIRIRKENQVYSAEEQRALAMFNYEERANRETSLIYELKEMLKKQNELTLQEQEEERMRSNIADNKQIKIDDQ